MAPRATMMQRGLRRLLRGAGQVAMGACGVAAITAVCFPLHPDLAIPAFLYLLLVVLQSAVAEFAASAIVSVIAGYLPGDEPGDNAVRRASPGRGPHFGEQTQSASSAL